MKGIEGQLMFFLWLFLLTLPMQSSSLAIQEQAVVTSVLDGDTIKVEIQGKKESVRFIGINTPEIAHFGQPAQCYGKEAFAFMKTQLKKGDVVYLEADHTQDNRDKYERLLRYVYDDSVLLNAKLVTEGFAKEYTYKIPYIHQKEFKDAQKKAKQEKKGLWKACQ